MFVSSCTGPRRYLFAFQTEKDEYDASKGEDDQFETMYGIFQGLRADLDG